MYGHEGNHQRLVNEQPTQRSKQSYDERHERMKQLANVCIDMFLTLKTAESDAQVRAA